MTTTRMVLCGGDPAATGVAESEVMKSMLDVEFARLGVASPTTLLDVWSRTTVGNALHAARLLKRRPGSDSGDVLLVSSEFHLPRALYFFEAVFAHVGLARRIGARPALTPPPDAGGWASGCGINYQLRDARAADRRRTALRCAARRAAGEALWVGARNAGRLRGSARRDGELRTRTAALGCEEGLGPC
jgi:hypothetical protein